MGSEGVSKLTVEITESLPVVDPGCMGTGKILCPAVIKGAGPCLGNCDHGTVVCPDCGGTGLKKA